MKIIVDTEKLSGLLEKLLLAVGTRVQDRGMEPTPPIPTAEAEFNSSDTHNLRWISNHNRAFVWLPHTGSRYGGAIRLTFDNGCEPLDVPAAEDNYGRDNGRPAYFCGTKNRPAESNGIRASVFGPKGCRATQVTVHYNR